MSRPLRVEFPEGSHHVISSDGLNKPKPKSLRKSGGRASDGQQGHPRRTLSQVAEPDTVVTHAAVAEKRQVFDLPQLRFEVTEHQVMQTRCPCGKTHQEQFPQHVAASVRYGKIPATMNQSMCKRWSPCATSTRRSSPKEMLPTRACNHQANAGAPNRVSPPPCLFARANTPTMSSAS